MHRLILASAAIALLGLSTVAGSAAPLGRATGAGVIQAPAITLAEGWWEQEGRSDAPDRYWQLKPTQRRQYDSAQTRIDRRHRQAHTDQYGSRDRADLRTQHRLLHYDTR